MEGLFSFLFKYRPLLFQEGEITFGTPWPIAIALTVGAVVAAVAVATYTTPRGRTSPVDRTVMAALKVGSLGVILLCLLQPTLVLSSTVAQRNFIGVLIDDSRSMTLPGEEGSPRSATAMELFGPESSALMDALEERFTLRFFRFSSQAGRIESPEQLSFDGTRTDLATALDRAREELSSVPVSGLVVLTDGADNGGRALAEALVPLQAASIPVYPVGLGDEALTPDVQIGRVEAPRSVLEGTSLLVDVVVSQRGFDGLTVPLIVEDEDRILTQEDVTLAGDGEPTVVRVRFTMEIPGPRRVHFRIPPSEGEAVTQNNERSLLVEVQEETEKILYFEGEPRHEVKFMRRAVEDDQNIQVVVLQRTAENKYLRLAVDDSLELAGGFPKTREELFQYRGLIIGSVEASFFTHDQLEMISDFAAERGGGLLVLGGRNAFAEGSFEGTPLAEAYPVLLGPPASDPRDAFVEVKVRPTQAGQNHVATQIRAGGEATEEQWDSLPPLSTMNRITEIKPGATALLEGEVTDGNGFTDGTGETRVVMAFQRYGRGKVAALPVQDTWTWQMHYDVPLEDQSHEVFWQQLLRWLVDGVPAHVEGRLDREAVEIGDPVEVTAEVNDSTYLAVNDGRVSATVTDPNGSTRLVEMDWNLERDGEYRASFTPLVDGDHIIRIDALRGEDTTVGSDELHLRVGPSDDEYFDAGMRRQTLERLARETGGRFYTPSTVDNLPEDLRFTGAGVTLVEERDLWDMPILLLMLVVLVGAEWVYRRTRGLV